MHQGGGLERMTGSLVGHLVRREPPQFVIDQRQQFVRGFGVTVLNGVEDLSCVASYGADA